ncbi:MAG TPA: hypothetical protein VFG77_00640 [Nitrososphaeraceae archaeon]|nr:hypothetical protein [Nitrososphaeraceae archaeon]
MQTHLDFGRQLILSAFSCPVLNFLENEYMRRLLMPFSFAERFMISHLGDAFIGVLQSMSSKMSHRDI